MLGDDESTCGCSLILWQCLQTNYVKLVTRKTMWGWLGLGQDSYYRSCTSLLFEYICVLTNSLFPRYVRTPGSLELNKYAIAIDISNSLDSNRRSNHELLGGGRLVSEFVSTRSSLRSLRRFLVLCCISLSVIWESNSVWEASPLWWVWAGRSSLGLLFTGIILSFVCKPTSTTSCQDLNGLEFGEEGVGCTVWHAWLSVITAVFLHRGAHVTARLVNCNLMILSACHICSTE